MWRDINPKQEQAYVSFSGKCGKCRSTTFWEQATHTSLEIEEGYSQEKWSAESQVHFKIRPRFNNVVVRSLKKLADIVRFVRFVLRGNEVRKVTINHFLRASTSFGNWKRFRTFRSQGKWSAESDDQPLFESKQRILAWKLNVNVKTTWIDI